MSRVVHFEIHASEPQALIDFYTAVLGWSFQRFGDADYWAISTADSDGDCGPGIDGGLTRRQGPGPGVGAPISGANVVIAVDDVDATYALALDQGGGIALAPTDMPGVGRLAYVRDPDENVVGFLNPQLSSATPAP